MKTIKSLGLLAALAMISFQSIGQVADTTITKVSSTSAMDTVIMEDIKTGETKIVKIFFPGDDGETIRWERTSKHKDDSTKKTRYVKNTYPKPIFGITFSNVDLGFSKPINNGEFNLTGENDLLKYRPSKTINFGFDVLRVGYRFNQNFRVFAAGGFEWNYLRLNKNIEFNADQSPYLEHVISDQNFRKNRLTSTYFRVPLTFELRGPHKSAMGRTKFAFGPVAGFLMKGTQRIKTPDGKKIKEKGDFGYAPFQYGVFARFGVGSLGVFGKYYFNDMFIDTPTGAELQNLSFGVTFAL